MFQTEMNRSVVCVCVCARARASVRVWECVCVGGGGWGGGSRYIPFISFLLWPSGVAVSVSSFPFTHLSPTPHCKFASVSTLWFSALGAIPVVEDCHRAGSFSANSGLLRARCRKLNTASQMWANVRLLRTRWNKQNTTNYIWAKSCLWRTRLNKRSNSSPADMKTE